MTNDDVTSQILSAWDEDEPVETPDESETELEQELGQELEPGEAEVEAEAETVAAEPEPEEEEAEEEEPEEEEETGETEEEEKAEETEGFQSDDPAVRSYLAKYQGDVERALKAASRVNDTLARQGFEKNALTQRVNELETELAQQQALSAGGYILNQEQREWVDEAAASPTPSAYVQQAIRAGEFELARAVCSTWAQDQPYEAMRVSQAIDTAEWTAQQQTYVEQNGNGGGTLDHATLMEVIVDNFPDMPQYEPQMVSTLAALGDNHPLVEDARSPDPQVAARGIIGLYEIARASSATVKQARDDVAGKRRQAASDARRKGVVASGGAAPSPGEIPAPHQLGPGLTLEALDEEWNSPSRR